MNSTKIIVTGLIVLFSGTSYAQKTKSSGKAKKGTESTALVTPIDSFSYAIGVNIATSLKNENLTEVKLPLIFKGFEDVLIKNKPTMSAEQAQNTIQQKLQEYAENKKREAKKQCEDFFAENKKRKGVIALPNGLQYEVLQSGDASGISPSKEDTVVVDYVGTLIDGKEFDNSIKRGQPATFPLNGVIKGWTEILQLMHVGDKWKVYIPSELGYGERGAGGSIPGNAALIFEINLKEIKKAASK